MKSYTLQFLVVLSALLPLFAQSRQITHTTTVAYTPAACQAPMFVNGKQETPLLSIKSSETDGSNIIFTYNISLLEDTVLKVLDNIKNSHKAGSSVAFEFYLFEVDQTEKTVKIGMGDGIITQQKLMEYLQKRLNASL